MIGEPMVVTVTSMKGGVGKTTIAAMLARYLTLRDQKKIIVLDMDPQGGASSILLGGRIDPPTLVDILRLEAEGIPSGELINQAARKSRHDEHIFVVPGHADLVSIANADPPLAALKNALESAPFPEDTVLIVDTGTHPTLVTMGIIAADIVIIPVMLSQQTAKPTINTLKVALQHHRQRGALLPMGIGSANWEDRELERWRRKLQTSQALTTMGFEVLPGIPYSRSILRGRWRYGTFPKKFAPVMDEICQFIFRERSDEERSKKANPAPDQDQAPLGGNGRRTQFDFALHTTMETAHGR
jgi:cellulose biosynthesis protein BcsQ